MLLDYHVHTSLCKHAVGIPSDYVAKALSMKISELGFSDHCPFPVGYDEESRMAPEEFDSYRNIVQGLVKQFDGRIKILFGIEADWVPGEMNEVFEFLDANGFDYVIGSVHYVGAFPFDNPEKASQWSEGAKADSIWEKYAELLLDLVRSGKFDILGHIDLPKKFGYMHSDMNHVNSIFNGILKEAGKAGMAIEINTSGLRKPVGRQYPSPEILKMAALNGLKLTLGSDAHSPQERTP